MTMLRDINPLYISSFYTGYDKIHGCKVRLGNNFNIGISLQKVSF